MIFSNSVRSKENTVVKSLVYAARSLGESEKNSNSPNIEIYFLYFKFFWKNIIMKIKVLLKL